MAETPISPLNTDSQPHSGKILLQSATRSGFAGLRILFLIGALISMIVQLLTMLKVPQPTSFVWTDYILVMAAVLLFLLFLLVGRKGGEIRLYADHVEGKRSMGVPFSFPIADISDMQLQAKRLAIKGKSGEILLMETPREPQIGGAIWMRKHYSHWEPQVWEKVDFRQEDVFVRATRFFLGTDNAANFGDKGFLVPASETLWFFPESSMFPVKGQSGEPTRPYMRSTEAAATMVQIEPNPETLPLTALCTALVRSGIDPKAIAARMEELAEIHGGSLCFPSDPAGQFLGECLGYNVIVVPEGV